MRLAVEAGEAGFHREQQHARHHDEQRHAAAHETARKGSCEECGAVVVELADEGVAAVRKDHQEAGGHAQQVYPADAFAAGAFGLGSRFSICLSGLIGFLRRYEKKRAATIFFRSSAPFFVPGRTVRRARRRLPVSSRRPSGNIRGKAPRHVPTVPGCSPVRLRACTLCPLLRICERRACDRAVSLPALPVCSRPAVRPARGCRPRASL